MSLKLSVSQSRTYNLPTWTACVLPRSIFQEAEQQGYPLLPVVCSPVLAGCVDVLRGPTKELAHLKQVLTPHEKRAREMHKEIWVGWMAKALLSLLAMASHGVHFHSQDRLAVLVRQQDGVSSVSPCQIL